MEIQTISDRGVRVALAWRQWIDSDEGKKCLAVPVTEEVYLYNRLWWAYTAGSRAGEESPAAGNLTREEK
jgi:hypothetical protein